MFYSDYRDYAYDVNFLLAGSIEIVTWCEIQGDHESLVMGQSSITPKVDEEF